ncbi:hypothetical protein [Yinghuangia seranimata]|uniref:hypothetical protein n=1 Tax=Yinghuangia seranimata TaxID=408067 RepID=UPI00248AC4BE|nr:hypothetical protein [Yinghuangia seranimata]MDI2128200.1 hypothetical protein [Yinghuangia seranimata]
MPNLSPAERAELEALLKANEGNDLFAESVMTAICPTKLLSITKELEPETGIPGLQIGRQPRDQALIDLLGSTLASASPALANNQGWMNDLKQAGRGGQNGTFSQLLRNGEYDAKFLNDVGGDMIDLDRTTHTNALGSDNPAKDGIAGLMVALKNSPDAAAHFFEGDTGKDRIEYLVDGRLPKPPHGQGSSSHMDALGQALVAGSVGRTDEHTVSVLENTVSVLADKGVADVLKGSVTQILAGNVESMHLGLTQESAQKNTLGLPDPGTVANIPRSELKSVLGDLADSPGRIALLKEAEEGFAKITLDRITVGQPKNPADPVVMSQVNTFAHKFGEAVGVLDESVAQDVRDAAKERDETQGDKYTRYERWGNAAVSTATAYVVSRNPIGGVAIGAFGTSVSGFVSEVLQVNKPDSQDVVDAQVDRIYTTGIARGEDLVNVWSEYHPEYGGGPNTSVGDGYASIIRKR